MKKIFLALAIGASTLAFSQSAKIAEAKKGQQYGAGVAESATFNVRTADQIIAELQKKDELKNVIIEAEVTGVCEKKGCWLTLKNSKNETLFVKMKDYAFFMPQSILGKKILLQADVSKKITSVDELKHYAEDAKKSAEEISKITQPKTEYRVLASGIKVVS